MDTKEVLLQWIKKFFGKTFSGGAVTRADKSAIKSEIMTIQQLAKDLLLMKNVLLILLLMKNVLKTLAKGVVITLGLIAVALVAEATIHKKNLRIGDGINNFK